MATSRLGIKASGIDKLNELGFDPLEAQVRMYNNMLIELDLQEQIKAGTLIRLNAAGKERPYSERFHTDLMEKAANLAEKLSRYAYARVTENADSGKDTTPPSLHIHLSDKEGTFSLNVDQSPSNPE